MRMARKPIYGDHGASLAPLCPPQRLRPRAANDNVVPDRAAALTVAIGQMSVIIASLCGIVAIALKIAH